MNFLSWWITIIWSGSSLLLGFPPPPLYHVHKNRMLLMVSVSWLCQPFPALKLFSSSIFEALLLNSSTNSYFSCPQRQPSLLHPNGVITYIFVQYYQSIIKPICVWNDHLLISWCMNFCLLIDGSFWRKRIYLYSLFR